MFMKEIKKINAHQSAKVLATMLMLTSLVFVVPFTIWTLFFTDGKPRLDSLVLLLVPIFYAIGGYIVNIIMFFFYNLAAKLVGGIEIEIVE